MFYGNKKIKGVNYGGIPIKKAYYGSQLVWEKKVVPSIPTWADGVHAGHYYIDLGLPSGLLWACFNIRYANSNESIHPSYAMGLYFQWGNVVSVASESDDTCIAYNESVPDFSGQPRFDAAASQWGNGWRMPTYNEFYELINECGLVSMNTYPVADFSADTSQVVTVLQGAEHKKKRLYLPHGGWRNNGNVSDDDEGMYWASTPGSDDDLTSANRLNLYKELVDDVIWGRLVLGTGSRALGRYIRPVLDRSSLRND